MAILAKTLIVNVSFLPHEERRICCRRQKPLSGTKSIHWYLSSTIYLRRYRKTGKSFHIGMIPAVLLFDLFHYLHKFDYFIVKHKLRW